MVDVVVETAAFGAGSSRGNDKLGNGGNIPQFQKIGERFVFPVIFLNLFL